MMKDEQHVFARVLLALVCLPGARAFDVIRPWLEFVPALAAIAGLGGGELLAMLGARLRQAAKGPVLISGLSLAVVLLAFLPVLVWSVRNHPNQIAYYNPLVGRLPGARRRGYPDATDYWGSVYRQGLEWLNDNVADEEPALVVGVAEHIVYYVHQTRLDRRITLKLVQDVKPETIRASTRPIYLMYITRQELYPDIVKFYQTRRPVHTIKVDGAAILEIKQLTPGIKQTPKNPGT